MNNLLEKQIEKLGELELQFSRLFDENPTRGHGGTPFVDNSKGRAQRRYFDKYQERLSSLNKKIKEQKEKIERTKSRDVYRTTVTKKSVAFTEKNPIHPSLLKLAEQGKLKQWPRNPHIFFVVALDKVALSTFDGVVGVNARFPAKTENDWEVCKRLIAETKAIQCTECG